MTPGVFNLKYLSFYLAKYQKKRQFWNSQNLQFSTLTLLFEFGQVGAEILEKKNFQIFFVDTVYIHTLREIYILVASGQTASVLLTPMQTLLKLVLQSLEKTDWRSWILPTPTVFLLNYLQ